MSALIRLYPRSWRARYEPEFLDLLEARPPSVRDQVDIIRGAIDARLDSGAPRESNRQTRIAAASAVAAGALWIMWLLMSMEAFDGVDGESVRGVGRIVSLFAGLAALASHLSLGIVSLDRMRGWGGPASAIAAIGFALTLFGGGAAALVALVGSIGLATAVAGRTIPTIVAVLWVLATLGVFAAFNGLVRTQWTDPTVLYQAMPYGLVWIFIGATIAMRGVPARASDGAHLGSAG
ncbi:MAG TPA: hypothetical protein VFN41_05755 [Candidatus Limnocylindrales bacterium]|nr:hypothetical protein [Candidatus Limnocylindrales bacterium]